MSLIQNARKPTLSVVRSCSKVRYNSSAAPESKRAPSLTANLFARLENNAAAANTYRGVDVKNINSPRLDIGSGNGNVWKSNSIKLDNSMREPARPRRPRPSAGAPEGQTADPNAAAARIMSRQPDPFNVRPPRRDGETRGPRDTESRPQRNGESRTPRDGQRQAGPRDGERRGRREGSWNDRAKQAGNERIKQTRPDGRTEQRSADASSDFTRERPVKAVSKAAPLRMSTFRTAHFGNSLTAPATEAPVSREAEVLRALNVPKEHPEGLVIKPRKKDVRVEKGVRAVKKHIVMRGSKRIIVDPRVRRVLEHYGGDYSRLVPRSALSGLHKPKQPLAYAKATLTLRPYLSNARRAQALDVVEKFVREARAVV